LYIFNGYFEGEAGDGDRIYSAFLACRQWVKSRILRTDNDVELPK